MVEEVVYGVNAGSEELEFMKREVAEDFAALWQATRTARTFREFRALVHEGVWRRIEMRWEWLAEDGGQVPDLDDPFDCNRIPGAEEGDWEYPPAMKAWIPKEIQDRFGYRGASPLSGDYDLGFEAKHEAGIVAALEEAGYRCSRADALVNAALDVA